MPNICESEEKAGSSNYKCKVALVKRHPYEAPHYHAGQPKEQGI
jgi:hypothetical protein